MIGIEMGNLLKCVRLYEKFINISETQHMLGRNIAASSLFFMQNSLLSKI